MRQRVLAAALAAVMGLGMTGPALARGKTGTRITAILTAAAAFVIPNYHRKLRERQEEVEQTKRRQSAYRDWYFKRYGYYPSETEFARWYKQTYGVNPQTS